MHLDPDTVIMYLADRKRRALIFFNIAGIIMGSLIAKIATNFAGGEPGLAGFRVNESFNDSFLIGSSTEPFRCFALSLNFDTNTSICLSTRKNISEDI